LRDALGDSADTPVFVETLARRGYRFIAPVDNGDISAAIKSGPLESRTLLFGGLAACILAAGLLVFFGAYRSTAGQPKVAPVVTNTGEKDTPSLSPDGQHLAFAWNGGVGAHFNLYVKAIGTEESIRLTDQPSIDFNPVWSPDGRYLAFCRIQGAETGIYLIPSLGGSERRVRATHWREDSFYQVFWHFGRLSWSPTGDLLAYSDRTSDEDSSSIFLFSLDSSEMRRLTSPVGTVGDYNPAFSPDGRTLAFNRGTQGITSIYTVPVVGGTEHRLISGAQYGWGLAWTPDGRDIVFGRAGWLEDAAWLWKIPARGGQPQRLQVGQAGVEPSIRGDRLVYTRQTANINIWKRSLASSDASSRGQRFIESTRIESGPQIAPDGTRIAFESTRSGAYEIWSCRHDGSALMQLTHFNAVSGTPRWSPDGKQIAFDSSAGGNTDIFTMDAQGASIRKLTSDPSSEVVPSWSQDGRWIYFASDRTGAHQIWKIPSSGGSPVQVTRHGGFGAFESPDGEYLYYAKGRTASGLWRVPVRGGEETEIIKSLEAGLWGYWALVPNGIYYLDTTGKPAIAFFNHATRRTTRLFELENRPAIQAPGLAVSFTDQNILYTQLDAVNRDIILVEDFR
jgi:Tol biopolymer transport system component